MMQRADILVDLDGATEMLLAWGGLYNLGIDTVTEKLFFGLFILTYSSSSSSSFLYANL